jgi:5-methyltetrahydrofolate--homocysteine methyltransferase
MKHPYLELIDRCIPVLFDGAVGTEIQKKSVAKKFYENASGCNEILNVNCPEVIIAIHNDYLAAGADVIQTNTFGGSRAKLKEYGLEGSVYEINKSAAVNACKAIREFSTGSKPLFVCGSLGPTGFLPSSKNTELSGANYDELVDIYQEQTAALVDGGIDFIRIETSQDLLEVRAAMEGIKRVTRVMPIQVQITIDTSGHMLLGSGIESFLGAVIGLGASVVGVNCGMGPREMSPSIMKLLALSPVPVAALPNAGMPQNVDGKAYYALEPAGFAQLIEPLVTVHGLSVVGGCCGTSPAHICAVSKILEGKKVANRDVSNVCCWLSTGIDGVNLETLKRPIIIGERLNTQGSKKTKELVLANNNDELFQIALEQSNCGSAILDICVAVNERDTESETMKNLVWFLSDRSRTPFCIDTTEPLVMTDALKVNPGSMMINSINLEQNAVRARKVLELAVQFGSPVVALTIDDDGMARTVEKKLQLAKTLRNLACGEFGLPEHFLYIDPLVFTLATGEAATADAALLSLDALKKIKTEMPGVRTVMGVSNVSFGLKPKARRVLNNLMLSHAVKAGLDAAIFNPLHVDDTETYDPHVKTLGENLLFNRSAGSLSEFVQYFETVSDEIKKTDSPEKKSNLPPEERLKLSILNRDRRDIQENITLLLEKISASDILNTILLPAMAEVGEKMSSGEMILPFVLQAAEIMKESVNILEPYLRGSADMIKGKIILATVYGDVHDIGKNLVGSILRNQGYAVIDLGKQVSIETIVAEVKKEQPDAVGLSALLVTTSRQMKLCVEEFDKQGIKVPVFIGGAAVNKAFAERIAQLENKTYEGGVFYAKDAFDASRMLDNLESLSPSIKSDLKIKMIDAVAKTCESSPLPLEHAELIAPPFWGTSEVLLWSPENLLNSIETERLFKAEWGGGKLDPSVYLETKVREFDPTFELLKKEILEKQLIDARGFYGFFPVITEKECLIVLDPDDFSSELLSFSFPRMPRKNNRSIIDYFRPEGDLIGVQVVSIGRNLGDRCRALFQKEDKYSQGFLLNGIGNYIVENIADRMTLEIRKILDLGSQVGRRYSFGFPGLPSLEDQKKLFEMMGAEERLGIKLTDGFQMDPEHSTLGIFVQHPKAEYLS